MNRFTSTFLPCAALALVGAAVISTPALAGAAVTSPPVRAAVRTNAAVETSLKARSHLLGALAGVYADKQFALSAATMTLKNPTAQALRGYRVRFQLVDYSPDWSAWNRHASVAPGAAIEDHYYPILDVTKVNKIVGVRWVYLKAEYQYRQADGQLIRDSETVRLKLLGRNLVEYSDHPFQPKLTFAQNWELTHLVMASVVSAQDPVIHQLAGRICGRLGGSSACYSPEETKKYMKALYDFMADYITYKSPDGDTVLQRVRQHLKFGRDVLTDRAGTCIELAILFASACEAMGLEPVTILIPGHVFAGVKVHVKDKAGKDTVNIHCVELTVIGKLTFEKACEAGDKKFVEWVKEKKTFVLTDIKAMRALGVNPMDLPAVEATWLAKVCPKKQGETTRRRPHATPSIVGTWRMTYRHDDERITQVLKLNTDGTCRGIRANQLGRKLKFSGTYRYNGQTFGVTITSGDSSEGSIRWINDNKFEYTGSDHLIGVRVR